MTSRFDRLTTAIALLPFLFVTSALRADAQEICGDGTTFTVSLPSVAGGSGDSITLPHGCSIYALLVSGYSRNNKLDELTFYNLAKFVTEHNGYVHWAWWNNLLREYLAGPLHTDETFTIPLIGLVLQQTPGGLLGIDAAGFVPSVHELGLVPKAVPEEDFQFQADAKAMLEAVRAQNPGALIVVAGHSMGGNSVARLGADSGVDIDLLAPIDPVGNRSSPVGLPTKLNPIPDGDLHTFNWTRWRATREFGGFRFRDCVRNGFGFCENFGSFFHPQYHCQAIGSLLTAPPPFPASLAPIVCPDAWEDPGTPLVFKGNIKRLYYRWQTEAVFPFDFPSTYYYSHWAPMNAGSPTTGINVQLPVATCADPFAADPLDPSRLCSPTDGHGEIVGFRTPTPGQPNPPGPNFPVAPLALQALEWPQFDGTPTSASGRRTLLLEMPTADASWPHRPLEPDLDLVSGDMVTIVAQLLASSPASSLRTVAKATPGPNANGWNNEDVVVSLTATAGPGQSVTEIEFSLTGAQTSGPTTQAGSTADVTTSVEGDTTLTFFARDNAGDVESPKQRTVRLDKTPPTIEASASPAPSANGWNNTDVTVTFSAADERSGIDTVDPPVVVTTEGANQEVTGTATDRAGNTAAAVLVVDLDKTPPAIALASRVPAPNSNGWNRTGVTFTWSCTDAISGPVSATVSQSVVTEGTAQTATGICFDAADNSTSDVQGNVNIDLTAPSITIAASTSTLWPPNGNLVPDTISGMISDALSGIDPTTLAFQVIDQYGVVQPTGPIVLGPGGTYAFTVMLQASRLGQDLNGRQYQIVVSAQDKAGNPAAASTIVTVPHDQMQ
jgi:hypothetical protein